MGKLALQLGVFLLLCGLLLRVVETFELSAGATRVLAGWVGPSPNTPHGAVRQAYIDTAQPRHRVTPPIWLGWSCLSAGIVLVARGVLKR
jgi:hypothetical protein